MAAAPAGLIIDYRLCSEEGAYETAADFDVTPWCPEQVASACSSSEIFREDIKMRPQTISLLAVILTSLGSTDYAVPRCDSGQSG
jgi:hypothetical protein